MLIIGSREQVKEYREHPGINQSTLKNLQNGLAEFLRKEQEAGPVKSFEIGSAVDCLLTAPEGTFEQEFYVSILEKKPSETEMSIVQMVFDQLQTSVYEENIKLSDCTSLIQDAIETVNWQPNWKIETRIQKIAENPSCQEYFEDLKQGQGKTILSSSQYLEVMKVVESLKENPVTGKYFDRETLEKEENLIVLYQVPIYFKYEGHQCKTLPDLMFLTINDKREILNIEILDLKTTSRPTLEFPSAINSFRYDIQAAFYQETVRKVEESFWTSLNVKIAEETKLSDFSFIVESVSSPGNPLIFKVHHSLEEQGEKGIPPTYLDGIKLHNQRKGFIQLLAEYFYYQENGFEEDIILKDKEGILTVDINGIVG